MNIHELLQTLSDRIAASASIKNVYGEPVTVGNRTVIPVARVTLGFGGGAGEEKGAKESHGGGGGGGVVAKPCGALEITPEGTRFIAFADHWRIGGAIAAGFIIGTSVARCGRGGGRKRG
jgi:uncharacterized spore protein YtfJ